MWENQTATSFIQILAWISVRFSGKLHYYGEKYIKTVPAHIFTVSPTLGMLRNNSPQMTFCARSSVAHFLRSPCHAAQEIRNKRHPEQRRARSACRKVWEGMCGGLTMQEVLHLQGGATLSAHPQLAALAGLLTHFISPPFAI